MQHRLLIAKKFQNIYYNIKEERQTISQHDLKHMDIRYKKNERLTKQNNQITTILRMMLQMRFIFISIKNMPNDISQELTCSTCKEETQ